jgi:hypothetical protein
MMTPHTLRITGRYVVRRPLTLSQLSERLRCSLEEARALAGVQHFPHAFIDRDGNWRIPVADVDTYIWCTTLRGAREDVGEDV